MRQLLGYQAFTTPIAALHLAEVVTQAARSDTQVLRAHAAEIDTARAELGQASDLLRRSVSDEHVVAADAPWWRGGARAVRVEQADAALRSVMQADVFVERATQRVDRAPIWERQARQHFVHDHPAATASKAQRRAADELRRHDFPIAADASQVRAGVRELYGQSKQLLLPPVRSGDGAISLRGADLVHVDAWQAQVAKEIRSIDDLAASLRPLSAAYEAPMRIQEAARWSARSVPDSALPLPGTLSEAQALAAIGADADEAVMWLRTSMGRSPDVDAAEHALDLVHASDVLARALRTSSDQLGPERPRSVAQLESVARDVAGLANDMRAVARSTSLQRSRMTAQLVEHVNDRAEVLAELRRRLVPASQLPPSRAEVDAVQRQVARELGVAAPAASGRGVREHLLDLDREAFARGLDDVSQRTVS